MNQYLNENNQNMIWKVINNAPQIIHYFNNFPPGTQEKWFQNIIGNIYHQFNGSSLSLKELNKRTLDFMLQSIEVPAQKHKQQGVPVSQQHMPPQKQSIDPQYVVPLSVVPSSVVPSSVVPSSQNMPLFDTNNTVKPREQILTEQFEMRKKEYESMVKKPVPKPEFTNAIKDDVINDISSAVEEYMKQRNADIPAYSPIKPNEEINLNIEEIPETKKRVQWGDNSEHTFDNQQPVIDYSEKIKALESQIRQMDTTINDMVKRIETLEKRV
jgi:hypothetical protein